VDHGAPEALTLPPKGGPQPALAVETSTMPIRARRSSRNTVSRQALRKDVGDVVDKSGRDSE